MVRAGLTRPLTEGRKTMLGADTIPLLDQGSIQFMLLAVMILAVAVVLWITLPR